LSAEEAALARQYLFAVYRGELRYWDHAFAEMWAELEAAGYLEDTLVVYFADHGEQFGEHDGFQHGKALYSEENRVPAAFWARNLVPGRYLGPTIHQDLAPTVLDALGLDPSDAHTGAIIGLEPEDRARFSFCYLPGYCDPMMSVVAGDHQLIYRWDGKKVFYDVAVDPDEQNDLYSRTDPEVQALWGRLQPEIMAVYARWSFMVPVNADP
jgi:hypothetical protein